MPKYERVKNYIEFIHDKKMENLRKSVPQSALLKFQSKHNMRPNGKVSEHYAELEVLR